MTGSGIMANEFSKKKMTSEYMARQETIFTNMRYRELFLSNRVCLVKNKKVSNKLELWKIFPS